MERKRGGSTDHFSMKMLNTKVCKCSFCTRFCSRTSWIMGHDPVMILKNGIKRNVIKSKKVKGECANY